MGKLGMFAIMFNSPMAVCYSGQFLQGQVTLVLNEEMKMREIRMRLRGQGRVYWEETHTRTVTNAHGNSRTETYTKSYSANESYIDSTVRLFGGNRSDSGHPILGPGQHTYPFRLQIPPGCPSSFEDGIGSVRYSVQATIDRPWRFDHNTKRAFTVLSLLDLNLVPGASDSAFSENQKTLGCLCCESGPITANLILDRIGYVPGESIPIKAEINNLSNSQMNSSKVDIVMTVFYHATTKTKTNVNTLTSLVHGCIEPGDSDVWLGDRMVVPAIPPSYLNGCGIIDINYTALLTVVPPGPSFNLKVFVPIIIGSIPLRATLQQYGTPAPYNPSPSATGLESAVDVAKCLTAPPGATPTDTPEEYPPDMPPPSYAQCMMGSVNIREPGDSEHMRGELDYAPVYTYYNWHQHNPMQRVSVHRQEEEDP